ncbi:alpha/beta hydrolase [Hamadaea tsunoensis]|uniref:alpha/beta hydrolase n=1 Tax=Hamadaea tsunoensis TaxID=53368 RepID=UPI001B7FACA3|nr:alpha/beta hydrolase [Hamadaea tsunoensis]
METDILGAPYEQHTIELPDDDEGQVVATLVRHRAPGPTGRAVLYVHGFNDYFFQTHLAEFYAGLGYDFYALDLRKYGRSLRGHQTPNYAHSMADYFPELDEAVRIVREEDGHDVVLLNGHSTGGLIASLYAHARRTAGLIDGLFLNSPFLDFNIPWLLRRPLAPAIAGLANTGVYRALPGKTVSVYGQSLHVDHHGEWAYSLDWKPVSSFPVRLGWLRAIRNAHTRVRAGLRTGVPILVATSDATYRGATFTDAAHDADAVLDVDHIARWAPNLGTHVTLVRIPGGKHDLTLSREPARARLFDELGRWMGAYLPTGRDGTVPTPAATPADHG